ncbi:hypothetical protein F4802DRAFT_575933 [Xylaria palmicola]|nr:hypothetical protein F4802DRAFT_575933 [Xylaria palmicola]
MLLTSAQVSVLITCGIVLLCTSALFISGCLIQQRTLRDLRSAIRPAVVTRPKPRSWDTAALARAAGMKTTIRLEDGTLVEIQGGSSSSSGSSSGGLGTAEAGAGDELPEVVVVEVRPTTPPDEEPPAAAAREPAAPSPREGGGGGGGGDGGDGEGDEGDDEPPALDVKGAAAWDGVQEGGEPLSRIERRKRIKAEIQRLSQGDTPVYYQRRLW